MTARLYGVNSFRAFVLRLKQTGEYAAVPKANRPAFITKMWSLLSNRHRQVIQRQVAQNGVYVKKPTNASATAYNVFVASEWKAAKAKGLKPNIKTIAAKWLQSKPKISGKKSKK